MPSINNSQKDKLIERAINYFKHAEKMLHKNSGLFLTLESAYIAAFLTIIHELPMNKYFLLPFILTILGILCAFTWFYTNGRLIIRLQFLFKKYLKDDEVSCVYQNCFNDKDCNIYSKFIFNIISTDRFFHVAMPIIFVILWICCYAVHRSEILVNWKNIYFDISLPQIELFLVIVSSIFLIVIIKNRIMTIFKERITR